MHNCFKNSHYILYVLILAIYPVSSIAQELHPQRQLTVSNLPIIVINTLGNSVNRDSMITANMNIIDNGYGNVNHINDAPNGYSGYIGIRYRGHSSYTHAPKKSYRIETRDASGNDTNVSLLGMPAEDDWALIANYADKTLMRNTLTYTLAAQMGYWAPRNKFCEVLINNDYVGVFSLTETVKRDPNRVPIKRMDSTDISGNAVSGGYIIKIDKFDKPQEIAWTSAFQPINNPDNQNIFFQLHYPKLHEAAAQQINYIKSLIDSFEFVLNSPFYKHPTLGYYRFVDLQSFINYFIMQELTKNVDAYRLSTYLYKDRDSEGGVLTMGPIWDFDLAYRNAEYCQNFEHTGWAYNYGNICSHDFYQPPFWWERFLTDTLFTNQLKCDWLYFRSTTLDTTHIFAHIDSMHAYINQAQSRNFTRWPIIGHYVWPNPHPIPQSYQGEIDALKKWLRNRLEWLDNNMPGICTNTSLNITQDESPLGIYPIPSSGRIFIEHPQDLCVSRFEIYDTSGRLLIANELFKICSGRAHINVPLDNGLYILRLISKKTVYSQKIIIKH